MDDDDALYQSSIRPFCVAPDVSLPNRAMSDYDAKERNEAGNQGEDA